MPSGSRITSGASAMPPRRALARRRKRTDLTFDPSLPACQHKPCGANGTLYRAHNWWCASHVRYVEPAANCSHPHTTTAPDGYVFCSWCAGGPL
jgi:hypothetical protein